MRIAQVFSRYYPDIGGVETHLKEISERLAKKGFDVEVLTTDPSGKLPREEIINEVRVKRFRSWAPNGIYHFSRELHKYLRNNSYNYDIIHAHGYQAFPMLSSAMSKRYTKAKFIITDHLGFSKIGKWIYSVYDPIFGKYIFDQASIIVIVSPATLVSLPLLSKYRNKVVYIPNGVDILKIDSYFKKYNIPPDDDELRIICVSRLEKNKGLDILIEALRYMNDAKFSLRIIGDGPYKQKLKEIVRNLSCKSEIRLLGRLDDEALFRNYAQSDVFVLLSKYESHSMALTEAMAFGLVPIVSDVGGNAYIVSNGFNGFLLKYPVEVKILIDLLQAIKKKAALLPEISLNAQKTVRERFDLNNTVEALARIYVECSRR